MKNKIGSFKDSKYVAEYGQSALNRLDYTKTMVNDIKLELRKNGHKEVRSILDIGCGIGDLDIALSEVFTDTKIIAIDDSEAMIEYAKRLVKNPNVSFLHSKIEEFYEKEEYFDLIVSQYSFEYWNYEKAIPNILRMLRPNGMIYFRNINPEINDEILHQFLLKNCCSEVEREDFEMFVRRGKSMKECLEILNQFPNINVRIWFYKNDVKNQEPAFIKYVKDKTINYNVIIKKG